MKTYTFDVVLKGVARFADEQIDALFEAGCDDATLSSSNGMARIHFDREAASLEEAIRSAVSQIQMAGLQGLKVEMNVDSTVSLGA